jgi:hypothetical protein
LDAVIVQLRGAPTCLVGVSLVFGGQEGLKALGCVPGEAIADTYALEAPFGGESLNGAQAHAQGVSDLLRRE